MIPSTISIPAALFLLTLVYYLIVFFRPNKRISNVRKHPPGPLALPIIGNMHLLGKAPHRNLQSLANEYGPIMFLRLGKVPTIVVSSPEATELFLKIHDPTFADRPQTQASEYLFYGSKGLVFSEYGSYWRQMKKLSAQHLFGVSNQELIGRVRNEEIRKLVKSLENDATMGKVINITEKVHGLFEDLVYKIVLGRNKDGDFDLKGLISEGLRLAAHFNVADIVPLLGALDLQGITRRMKEIGRELDELLEKIIKEHEQAPKTYKDGKREDFIDILLSLMHQPSSSNKDTDNEQQSHEINITREDIKANVLPMIAGAYETTAVTVDWILSELLRNPRVMKNLQDELKTVVEMDRMVEERDISKLNYLNLVIMENLRLHPVTAFIPRVSTEDIIVDGYFIEKKSQIFINLWAIGRNPKIWPDNNDVEVFYPERFLMNGSSSNVLQEYDSQLVSFGSGRRKCPGMQLALTTTKLVVAQLVHCFDWELPFGMEPSDLDMNETFGMTLPRSKHLSAVLTHRLSSEVYDA